MRRGHDWRTPEPVPTKAWLPSPGSPIDSEGMPVSWDEYQFYRCRSCGRILLVEVINETDPESGRREEFEESFESAYRNGRNGSVDPEGCDPGEATVWTVMAS